MGSSTRYAARPASERRWVWRRFLKTMERTDFMPSRAGETVDMMKISKPEIPMCQRGKSIKR